MAAESSEFQVARKARAPFAPDATARQHRASEHPDYKPDSRGNESTTQNCTTGSGTPQKSCCSTTKGPLSSNHGLHVSKEDAVVKVAGRVRCVWEGMRDLPLIRKMSKVTHHPILCVLLQAPSSLLPLGQHSEDQPGISVGPCKILTISRQKRRRKTRPARLGCNGKSYESAVGSFPHHVRLEYTKSPASIGTNASEP